MEFGNTWRRVFFDLIAGPEAKLRRYETLNGCEVREDLMVHGGKVINNEQSTSIS